MKMGKNKLRTYTYIHTSLLFYLRGIKGKELEHLTHESKGQEAEQKIVLLLFCLIVYKVIYEYIKKENDGYPKQLRLQD